MAESTNTGNCPLCNKVIKTEVCAECSSAIFPIISNTIKRKTNKKSPFQDIDNLVFQGGGVKGVAYLGVMKALEDENPDLLTKVKRVAGTSAGSMLALYLGLNKDPNEIEQLLSGSDYSVLLDDGEMLKVSKTKWLFLTTDYYFSSKEVLLKALDYLNKLQSTTSDNALKEKLVDIFTTVFTYLLSKIGTFTRAAMEVFGSWFIHLLANWLVGFLFPAALSDHEQPDQNNINMNQFIHHCKDASTQALDNVQKMRKELEEQGKLNIEDDVEIDEKENEHESSGSEALDNEKILLYAVTELIWSCLHGKKEEHAQETQVGLFTAQKVKENLIIKPIADSLEAIKQDKNYNAAEITFKELASLKKPNSEEFAFRPFYVTGFNTATFRTDVFSAEHSPDVVVADAIRASMSIPLFFQSVPIAEKGQDGKIETRKAYSCSKKEGVTILYMDGGIMDNYPIWIFDDLKYCLNGAIPDWNQEERVGIQNPNTLGFRLLDIDRIDNYSRPFRDHFGKKVKLVQDAANIGSYFAVIKYLTKVEFNEHEENSYAKNGDCFRTVYVYNCKISSINFKLDKEQKGLLISSGYKAVELFKERSEDSFKYELGTVFPTEEKAKEGSCKKQTGC